MWARQLLSFIFFSCALNSITCATPDLTLTYFKNYAASVEELPKSDDMNWIDPDYSSYQRSLTPNMIQRWLQKIGMRKELLITPALFANQLATVTKQRVDAEYHKKQVVTVTTSTDSKFFMWGSLYGAYHSLVRCLDYLHKEEVIDENLKIKNPNHYFVFTGDAINRSAHSMETLVVILTLMHNNPNQVFYMRGNHEQHLYWRNFGLRRQLQIRGRYLSDKSIPFAQEVDAFFDTLPDIMYVNKQEEPDKVFLFYFRGIKTLDDPLIDASYIADATPGVKYYERAKAKRDKTESLPFYPRALVRKENWLKESRAAMESNSGSGLGLLEQVFSVTNWATLSSPVPVNREFYKFANDAYVVLHIKESIDKSELTLYNQPTTNTSGEFRKGIPFNVVTGRLTTLPQSAPVGKDIVLGSSMSLVQGIPTVGQRVKEGIYVAVNEKNAAGGIKGRHLRVDIRDDGYTPNISRQNVLQFVEDKINVLLAPLGDATLASYKDLITSKKVAVLFPVAGGPQFRTEEYKGLVHLFATYRDGVSAMIEYLIAEYASNQFGFFYQDDDYGSGPRQAAIDVLQKHNITKFVDIPYTRGSVTFGEQVKKIKEAQIDTLGLFSTSYATAEFMRQLSMEVLANKQVFGSFLLGDAAFHSFAKHQGIPIILGTLVPNPNTSQIPIVKEYTKAMEAYGYPYDVFSLKGYLAARLTIELLESLEGELTPESIIEAAEKLIDYEIGGYKLSFNPKTRSLAQKIWIQRSYNEQWLERDLVVQ